MTTPVSPVSAEELLNQCIDLAGKRLLQPPSEFREVDFIAALGWIRDQLNELRDSRAPAASGANTLAGFRGGFIGMNGRAPTEQEIWNAAVRSGIDRTPAASGATPEGWKLVPIQPTKEMVAAAQFHTEHDDDEERGDPKNYRAKGQALAVWHEMIAAAPLPPDPAVQN